MTERKTHFSNTDLYPVITVDDGRHPGGYYLELTHSKITELVHVIPHLEKEGTTLVLDKQGALEVMAFLKEFVVNG